MIRKCFCLSLIIIFLCENALFAAHQRQDSILRAPLHFSKSTEEFIKKQNKGFVEENDIFPTPHQSKKISILFINPRSKYQASKPEKTPVSLLFLASTLTSSSYLNNFISVYPKYKKGIIPHIEVQILDLQAEEADFDLENFLRVKQPDIVGVTAPSQLFDQAVAISRIVKNTIPNALRLIGGPHVSALPQETLKDSEFQIGVMGFGEETLLELCMQYAQGEIDAATKGTVFKSKDGAIHVNPARDRKIPLSHAPPSSNSIDLLNRDNYRPVSFVLEKGIKEGPLAMIFTARGCPFTCKFCANPSRIVEKRNLEDIVAEMEALYQKGFRLFQFIDDTFSFDVGRVKNLCRLIIEKPWHTDIEWIASTRVDRIDEELISLMKRAGCVGIAVGLETGDEKLLSEMDKKIKLSDIRKAREICRKEGLSIKYFVMVGLPGQDWYSIKKTVNFILETDPTAVTVSIYTPYPGSPWWGDPRVKFVEGTSWEEMYSHPEPHPNLRYKPIVSHTETDYMTSTEISEARQLIVDIFAARYNPERKNILLDVLDKKISEALLRQALQLLARQNKYNDTKFKERILKNPYLLNNYRLFDLIREERINTVDGIVDLIQLYYPNGKDTEFVNVYPDVIQDAAQEPQPLGIGSLMHAHSKNLGDPIATLRKKKGLLPFVYATVSAFVIMEDENGVYYLISAVRAIGKESAGKIESVFGGHIDAEETIQRALLRVMSEELHIKIGHVPIIGYKRYDEDKEENNRHAFVGFLVLNHEEGRELLKHLKSRNIHYFIANNEQELESYMPDSLAATTGQTLANMDKRIQDRIMRSEEIMYIVLAPFELMVNFYRKTKAEQGMKKLVERFAWTSQRVDGTYREDNFLGDETLVNLALHWHQATLQDLNSLKKSQKVTQTAN